MGRKIGQPAEILIVWADAAHGFFRKYQDKYCGSNKISSICMLGIQLMKPKRLITD